LLFPNRFAEPDGEALDLQPAPARREKMTEFVDADEQVEQQHHFQRHEDVS